MLVHTIQVRSHNPDFVSAAGLDVLTHVDGDLHIELTVPPEPMGNSDDPHALPDAEITSIQLDAYVWQPGTDEVRDLTPNELDSIVFRGSRISLIGLADESVSHDAPNGEFFTVQDILHAIEETEQQTRGHTEWFGGIDVHHRYLDGFILRSEGIGYIAWGS